MALVPTERLQPPANEAMLGQNGQLTQAWQQHFQRLSDQTKTLSDALHTGTTTDDDAAAGMVGEFVTATAGPVALTSNVATTLTSISLTAGDWDVWGSVHFQASSGTNRIVVAGACSLTSGVLAGLPTGGGLANYQGASTNESGTYPITQGRLSLAATTVVYLVGLAGFSVSAMAAAGFVAARRAR